MDSSRIQKALLHPLFLLSLGVTGGVALHWLWTSRHKAKKQSPLLVYAPTYNNNLAKKEERKEEGKEKGKKKKPVPEKLSRRKKSLSGITVEMGRLRIKDWNTWMRFAPSRMELSLNAGARTSGDVLKFLLSTSLPEYAWPPEQGSSLREQWDHLSGVVARNLNLPNLPPTPRDQKDGRSHLRLIK